METVKQKGKMIESITPGGYSEGWCMSPRSALPIKVRGCGSRNKPKHCWHLPSGASFSWRRRRKHPSAGGAYSAEQKSHRLAGLWMGTDQNVRGKAQSEPQVKVFPASQKQGWCTCARLCCVLQTRHWRP